MMLAVHDSSSVMVMAVVRTGSDADQQLDVGVRVVLDFPVVVEVDDCPAACRRAGQRSPEGLEAAEAEDQQ